MLLIELINEIIINYNQQHELYLNIAESSRDQLKLLDDPEWNGEPEALNLVLGKRMELAAEVDRLNKINKNFQVQVNELLGLEEFMLSHLEEQLEDSQYQSLQAIVKNISNLLGEINDLDQKSHLLIKAKVSSKKLKKMVNASYVKNVYEQAMEQGKKQ